MVECYIDVDVGTLYYAVRQLEKKDLIAAVAQERVARGGVRTIYSITSPGRDEFRDGLHKQLEIEGPVSQTLYGAMLFLHLADPAIVGNALRGRIARLDELITKTGLLKQEFAPVLSTGGEHLFEHLDRRRRMDRSWLKALLADIELHGIHDVRDPKRLAPGSSARVASASK